MMILSNLLQIEQLCTSTSSLLTKFCISPTSGILDFHFRPPFTCSHLFSSFPPASCQLLLFTFRFFTAQNHLINACCSCVVKSPISNDSTFVLFYTAELKHKQEMCLLWFFLTPHILILSEWVQFVSLFCYCWELFCYVRRFPILQPRAACSLFSRVRNRDVQLANSQRAFPPRHNTLSSCTYVHVH